MTKIFPGKILIITLLLVITLAGTSLSYAQQSSEQYIPIGQSPGISDKVSYIGSVVEVDRATNMVVVDSNRGRKSIKVAATTRFWLDRSKSKQANIEASYDNVEAGLKVEIKQDSKDQNLADWIKIEPR